MRIDYVWQDDSVEWTRVPGGMIAVPNPDSPTGALMLVNSQDVITHWPVEEQEAVGIYAVEVPDPPPGEVMVGDPAYVTGIDGKPEAVPVFTASYPNLNTAQFAEFFHASGIEAPWLEKENEPGGPKQLLETERTSAPFDLSQVLQIRDYLVSVGAANVPAAAALQTAWTAASLPKPPVTGGAPYDPDTLYVKGDQCTHNGRLWEWNLPYSVPGYEPGPATWAAWKDMGATGGGIQPWTQRTAGVDMYGVGPHPDGAAAIGILIVSHAGLNYKLIGPDNWGFNPPTSIGASLTVWQLAP